MLLLLASFVDVNGENSPRFIENKGQYPASVHYKLRVANADVFFEKGELAFNVYDAELFENHGDHHHDTEPTAGHAYRVQFLNFNQESSIRSTGTAFPDYQNFVSRGNSVGHVKAFDKIEYNNIYSGIDIEYFGSNGNLKYDVKVAPGADPALVQMKYQGVSSLKVKNGKLIVANSINYVEESIPLAYQVVDGQIVAVDCHYRLDGETVSFVFPNGYDSELELIIDPTLIFSSYTGSTSDNFGFTATYDAAGALYGGGIVFGGGYPTTTGAYSTAFGGLIDIAISKFTPDGTNLIYSTYIGGSSADVPHSMIVNNQGELVILGSTSSLNYPTTTGAYDEDFNGGTSVNYSSNGTNYQNGSDIIVTVLSSDGASLVGSTYLGGSQNDGLNEDADLTYNYGDIFRGEVIIDAADNIYIATSTVSTDLPVTNGTVGQTLAGNQDACVAKFNPNLTVLDWCTYLGGDGADAGYSMKLNSLNELYVTGGTEGQGFQTSSGTLNTTFQGGQSDGFITRLSNDATSILSSTYIGTSDYDQTYFIEVDHDDDVYVYGQSTGGYPVLGSVYSNTNGKQFIQKLNSNLTASIFSTVFGNGNAGVNISPTAFLVDVCKRIYISGWGGGTNNSWNSATDNTAGMATTPDGFQLTTDGSDFYFMVLEANASSLLYATYFGGFGINEHVDGGTSRFNSDGVIHQAVCAGCGGSDAFPTTPGAVSNTNNSPNCNLGVVKLDLEVPLVDVGITLDTVQTGCVPFTLQFTADTLIAPEYVWYFGNGDSALVPNPTYTFDSPGVYEVLLIGRNTNCQGNQFVDTASVTVEATISTDSVDAGIDQFICPGQTAQLNATGVAGATYAWSPAGSLSNANISNPVASPTATTEYVVRAVGGDGCLAFDTVEVEVGLVDLEMSADTAICLGDTIQISASGGDTYVWTPNTSINDNTVATPLVYPSATTTYSVQSTTVDGCIGTNSVEITVEAVPVANAGPDQVICDGDTATLQGSGGSAYSWTPTTTLTNPGISNPEAFPSTTTEYVLSLENSLGCGTTDTATVTVNPLPIAEAGQDESICPGSSVQLQASGGSFYSWSPNIGLSNPNISNPIASPIFPRTYTVTVTDLNGCSDTDSVFVDVFVVEALGEAEICVGDSAQLSATGGVSWVWAPPIGLSDASAQNPWASPINTTTYTVFAQDGSGCSAIDSVTITVNPLPTANAGPDQELCVGGSVILQGSGGVNYTWSPATFLDDTTVQLPVATPSQSTIYQLTVTDANSCTDTDSVGVVVNPLPVVDAGPDSTICQNGNLMLQATGADTYVWSPLVGLDDPQSATPTASPTTPTTYYVIGTDVNGCINSDSVSITIFGVNPNSGDYIICLDDSVQAIVSGGATYSWSPTDGVSNPSSSQPFLSPAQTTDYVVSVTSQFGCEAQTLVNVQVLSLPIAAFTGTFEPTCEGIFGEFSNQSNNAQSYSWYFGNGETSSEFEPALTYENGAGPIVTLYAYNNDSLCVDSVTVDYSAQWFSNDTLEIDYANIFTPDFDGINDCFKPEFDGRYSGCYELKVFNRWGALIFESVAGQDHCWDGRTKGGNMVEEGTYYYISEVRGIDHAGYVTVIYP